MKNLSILVPIILLLLIQSCGKKNDNLTPSLEVNFKEERAYITENSIAENLIIEFGSAAISNAFIEISLQTFNTSYGDDFITQPEVNNGTISIPVIRGNTQAEILLSPTPDADQDVDSLVLTIRGGSSNIIIGTPSSLKVFITESSVYPDCGNGNCTHLTYENGSITCNAGLTTEELDIATWNIENFPMQTGTAEAVAALIESLDADIIAVQEIDEINAFNELIAALPDYEGIAVDVRGGIELGYIYKTNTITGFGTPRKLFEGQTRPFPREPIEVTVSHSNGLQVTLINLHLKCCGGTDDILRRKEAATLLKAYIDENLCQEAVVVLGDWNEDLIDGYGSFNLFLNDNQNYLFADYPINNGPSTNYSYPSWPSHLDHVLITNELCDNLTAAYTVTPDACVSDYASLVSDHRPVIVSLKADE